MSKRMSLVDAAKRKEEFIRSATVVDQEPQVETQESAPIEEIAPPSMKAPPREFSRAPVALFDETRRKKTTFNLDASLHRRVKLTAVRQEREMVEIVEEALNQHLRVLDRAANG